VTVTNGGYYPSTAIYTCHTGYVLTDSSLGTNQCTAGTPPQDPNAAYWKTQAAATCTAVVCGAITAPANGVVAIDGNTATFSCNDGYSRSGSATSTCNTVTREWTGPFPTCTAAQCTPTLTNPNFGYVTVTNGGYFPSTAIYTCNTGYVLTDSTLGTNQCNAGTGEFSATAGWNASQAAPTCTPVSCGGITAPANGAVVINANTATFSCNDGFALVSTLGTTRTCSAVTRQWTRPFPYCTAAECTPTLTNPTNGKVTVTNGGYYPSTAIYTCNAGYALADTGLQTNQCTPGTGANSATAAWNTQAAATCTAVACGAITPPADGSVTVSGTTATFSCNNGYSLTGGSSTSTCNESTLVWSGPFPSCAAMTCQPELSSPLNGVVYLTNLGLFPSTAMYTCNPDYFMILAVTSARINTCTANATGAFWIDGQTAPTCSATRT